MWWALALVLATAAAAAEAAGGTGGRFAYVTIHYEGTPADAEYVLGLRVLLRSLQPLQHPFVVLASSSVSQATRDVLTREGATIRAVADIGNPFGHVLARFAHTFNKLYLWNMTEYDRVIYLDADNVAVRRDMLADLFHCGHFCVVYMNPCHFHTGLMVVKPDAALYATMLQRLAATGSYDGADQGFLSSFFHACWKAPVFNPRRGPSEAPMNALHIGYNMHAIYYFAAGREFDSMKCGVFQNELGLAVATIGFPLPTMIKPWFWWTPLVGHTEVWDAVRSQLSEPELIWTVAGRMFLCLSLFALLAAFLRRRVLVHEPSAAGWLPRLGVRLGVVRAAQLLGVVVLLASHMIAMRATPALLPNSTGAILYSLWFVAVYLLLARVAVWAAFLQACQPDRPPLVPVVAVWPLALALAYFWSCPLFHAIYELLIGPGVHVILVHAVLGLVAIVGSGVNIFSQVASNAATLTLRAPLPGSPRSLP